MPHYFAYTRVSTRTQSQYGVSLTEQHDAIAAYAVARGLVISKWFEESETAARTGRKVFKALVFELSKKRAAGLIIHKIDRGARNLKEWAQIGDLIDMGIDVRFAHDDLRLDSRGGRLAADIQAVIAADYVRNMREEIRKGFLGRLKQGLYPLPAPFGYRNAGPRHAKVPDPYTAPLVQELFARYATGQCSLGDLADLMRERGRLSIRRGQLGVGSIDRVLRNPFYTGTIYLRSSGQTYPGTHAPLIDRMQFDQVQALLSAKRPGRARRRHYYAYAGLIRCGCGYACTGESVKGHVYYHCHRCRIAITEKAFEAKLVSRFAPRAEAEHLPLSTCIRIAHSHYIMRDGEILAGDGGDVGMSH